MVAEEGLDVADVFLGGVVEIAFAVADGGVFGDGVAPFSAHGDHGLVDCGLGVSGELGVEIEELLALFGGEAQLLKDRRDGIDDLGVEGLAVRDFEVVAVGDGRSVGLLNLLWRRCSRRGRLRRQGRLLILDLPRRVPRLGRVAQGLAGRGWGSMYVAHLLLALLG